MIDHLSALDNAELPTAGQVDALIQEVLRIPEKLIALSAGADRVVLASFRMAMSSIGCPAEIPGALRFLFTVGLVGSGITPPFDEDLCCDDPGADVQSIGQEESGGPSHG